MLAFDIGGANLKLADGQGSVAAAAFALWKAPERLAEELRKLADASYSGRLVVTMTGELADCYASKTEGVRHILSAVDEAFPAADRWIYLVDGRFVRSEEAAEKPLLTAASNWHALASFAARYLKREKCGMLIDVGSTTTDIIPIVDGQPAAEGTTDTTRMAAGELYYSGVERTACCAIKDFVDYRSGQLLIAKEFFATMKDVYIVLGKLKENADDCDTADNRPATKANAVRRLGKLVCADELEFNDRDAQKIAKELAEHQVERLNDCLMQVLYSDALDGDVDRIILSGHGEFLARAALKMAKEDIDPPLVSLTAELGPEVSRCATAHALAILARERLP